MSIRNRLLVVFLVLSLGPLALVGAVTYQGGRHAIEETLGELFELRAARTAETLDRETRAAHEHVTGWTRLERMQEVASGDPDGRLSAFLIDQVLSSDVLDRALVADSAGGVVAASHPEWLGRSLPSRGLAGGGCLDEPIGSVRPEAPLFTCSFPIRAAYDETLVIGVLQVTFELGHMIDGLKATAGDNVDRVEMFLLRRDGLVVSAPTSEPQWTFQRNLAATGSRAAALAGNGQSGFLVEPLDGRPHIIGYARTAGITGWSVLVGQDVAHAFAPVHRFRLLILGLASVLVALVVTLSFGLARRVTTPITALTRAARRVAGGGLDQEPLPASRDEIGLLTADFNDMVAKLRAQRAQLVEKDYLDSIIAHMVDGLIVIDAGGRLLTANPALLALVGRRHEDLAGQDAASLFSGGAETLHARVLGPVRRTGAVRGVETELDTTSGQKVPVLLSAGALPAGPGGSGAIVCILTDMTQRKKTEAELVRAREEAEAGARAKAQFLATMSHEIRTPLNGIIGMMELLVGTSLAPRQQDYVRTAQRSGEALLAIIGDILDYSRMDAGGLELDCRELDPRSCLEDVADVLVPRASEKSLELTVACDPAVPARVLGDEGRLRQVLLNLGSNAVKFTPQGHVILGARPDETDPSRIRFEVTDTGIGIPSEARERLFRPFSQVDPSTTRKYGGTGLGLAICRQIVDLMGGEIGVASDEGRGSTFWFSVPLPPAEIADQGADAEVAPLRVLVVDDNEVNRRVVTERLERWGCRPVEAADGWEALEILRSGSGPGPDFDLALVDFQMPEMDGGQLAAEIRRDTRLARLPLVLLTSVPQQVDTARQMGFQACLTKPVKAAVLRQAIGVAADPGPDRPPAPDPTSPPGPPRTAPRGRVLVVDDDPPSRKVARDLLEQSGCQCEVAASGPAALEALAGSAYDLILLDCHMPEMDGYDTTRRIREIEGDGDRTVIVAMTADAFAEDRRRCLDAGMDDHMAKPIRTVDVERLLLRHLPFRR